MAQPASRTDLINYCKRQLGAPVLEINVADEQIDDLVDDALQLFQERDYDGTTNTFLKYKITQGDIDRGRGRGGSNPIGIVTTTASSTIDGASVQFSFEENSNYLQIPPEVLGITKIYQFNGANTASNNMFSIRQDRLYLDIDWSSVNANDYLVIDCYRLLNPNDFPRVYNDSFLKRYLTALIKRQWGQNLLKFQGVKLPGGIELNGRQIYDDAEKELDKIREVMSSTYELPPLDFIG